MEVSDDKALMRENLLAGIRCLKIRQLERNMNSPFFLRWLDVAERENGIENEIPEPIQSAKYIRELQHAWHTAAVRTQLRRQEAA